MTSRIWRLLLSGAAVAAPAAVHAQNTPAGTLIRNQAQATYSVNGQDASVQSNVSTFRVDRKVDFSAVAQTGNTQVNLNQTGAVLTFTVTNRTNGAQDFLLDPDQQNLSVPILTGLDNFDVSNMRAFVDKNGNGTYEPQTDTADFIDELAPDASVVVFIVADVPGTPTAALAHVSLHVTAAIGGASGSKGGVLVATDLALLGRDDDVDIVFADDDSDGPTILGDAARNGQARVYAAYEVGVRTVALSIVKSSRVIDDGVNTLTPGRALPGATVEYCLLVRNATLTTPASNVVLTDELPPNVTYVPDTIKVGGTCLLGGEVQDDDANDTGDGRVFAGSYTAGTRTMSATMPTVPGGASLAAVFRVTID